MKAIYAKHVRAQLEEQMAAQFPHFEPFALRLKKDERHKATVFPGERIFRWVPGGDLHCFISVIPHQRQEKFMIEAGWSALGRFPYDIRRPTASPTRERKEFSLAECMVSFERLYHMKYGRAHLGWAVWKCSVDIDHPRFKEIFIEEDLAPVSEEQAFAMAKEAVRKAIEDTRDVVIPYLTERASL